MSKVFIEESTLTAIGDVVRENEGSTELIPPLEMPNRLRALIGGGGDGYEEGFAAGKTEGFAEGVKSEYDRFWDAYQDYGARTNYTFAFSGPGWTETTFKPKYPLRPINAANMFQNSAMAIDLRDYCDLDLSQATSVGSLLYGSLITAVGVIDLNYSHVGSILAQATNLETVEKVIFHPNITYVGSAVIYNCPKLREVRFVGEYKKHNTTGFIFSDRVSNLSKASIESLINVLSLEASGLSCQISKAAVDREFATSEGANNGSTSEEWEALVTTRPNWTISLV